MGKSGGSLTASATAIGGVGAGGSGVATATTTATGASGSFSASASTSAPSGQLVTAVSTAAQGAVNGTSTAKAYGAIGVTAQALTKAQAVAFETGAPLGADTKAVLNANAKIKTAFGAVPVFFGLGELGGQYAAGASGSLTTSASFSETVDLTQLASRQDLTVGFYGGTKLGTGVTGVTLTIVADGNQVLQQNFNSAAAATTYFTDNAVDLDVSWRAAR